MCEGCGQKDREDGYFVFCLRNGIILKDDAQKCPLYVDSKNTEQQVQADSSTNSAELSAIDPKAIRSACADKAVAFVDDNYNAFGEWDRVAFDDLRAAILVAEPTQKGEDPSPRRYCTRCSSSFDDRWIERIGDNAFCPCCGEELS